MTSVTYYTHWNGARPYWVVVENFTIKAYVEPYSEMDNPIYVSPIDLCYPGKSPKNKMTNFSGGHGVDFTGNSILVKTKSSQHTVYTYTFIGSCIYSFSTTSPIVRFISPIGNNDIPYPAGLDEEGNIYLFNENVIMLNKTSTVNKHIAKAYSTFYKHHQLPFEVIIVGPLSFRIFNHEQPFDVFYKPYPKRYITELLLEEGCDENSTFTIRYKNTTRERCSVEKYIECNTVFGQTMGFKSFDNFELIHSSEYSNL